MDVHTHARTQKPWIASGKHERAHICCLLLFLLIDWVENLRYFAWVQLSRDALIDVRIYFIRCYRTSIQINHFGSSFLVNKKWVYNYFRWYKNTYTHTREMVAVRNRFSKWIFCFVVYAWRRIEIDHVN